MPNSSVPDQASLHIEVDRRPNQQTVSLKVGGHIWATVSRDGGGRAAVTWRIEDSAGRCLSNRYSEDGYKKDDAVEEAKAMIQDGRIRPPEEAAALERAERAERHLVQRAQRHAHALYRAASAVRALVAGQPDLQEHDAVTRLSAVLDQIDPQA